MCEHLEAVTNGEINRFVCNVPPGSSKSLIFSVFWPAWEWGPRNMGHLRYLATSYNPDAIVRDNRKMRLLVMSEWYRLLWPHIKLKRWSQHDFENTEGGSRLGAAFASLTGLRGDRLLIDDPHSTKTAESEVQRLETIRLFREGALDRLNDLERSAIVVIMQRLHEEDITGLIVDQMPEQGFVHLMIPMRFEVDRRCTTKIDWTDPRSYEGELMEPQRFSAKAVDKMETGKGEYAWAGQYQQRPVPREGGMMKVDMMLIVDSVPGVPMQRIRGWDIAGSEKKTSPYTAGVRMCECMGLIYVENVVRARAEIDKAERLIIDTAKDDGLAIRQSLPQDPGQSGKSQRHQLAMRLTPGNFKFSPESGSKEDRAIPFASMVNAGLVRLVRGPWNNAFIEELRTFPAGRFKDQVDACSRAYAEIVVPRQSDPGIAAPMVFGLAE